MIFSKLKRATWSSTQQVWIVQVAHYKNLSVVDDSFNVNENFGNVNAQFSIERA